jgi:uncharacterized membrane protein
MNLRRFYTVAAVGLVAMLVVAAWGLLQVGPDASVPTHWDASGKVNGYAPAWVAFLMIPAITAGIVGLLALVPRIEPRRENLRRSLDAYRTMGIALVVLMMLIQVAIVLAGVGRAVPMALVVGVGMGLLFAVMGNVLTTVRSNFMFGVRTPWTLSSDRSWDRTHRLVGRLFVLTGVVMILVALTGEMALVIGTMLVMLAVTVAVGYAYSYRVWRADPDRRPTGSAA